MHNLLRIPCFFFCIMAFDFLLVISAFHLSTQWYSLWYKWDELTKLKRRGAIIRAVMLICFPPLCELLELLWSPCCPLCSPVSSSAFRYMQRHWLESDCCVSDWCPAPRLQQCITPHYPVTQRSHTLTHPSASDTLSWAGRGTAGLFQ